MKKCIGKWRRREQGKMRLRESRKMKNSLSRSLLQRLICKTSQAKGNLCEKVIWRCRNSHGGLKISPNWMRSIMTLTFVINNYKWKLGLLPLSFNGYLHLSLYLSVADSSSLPAGWSIPTNFSISIVNQIRPNKTIKRECEQTFNSLVASRGWDFNAKSGGYLVKDTCLIEAVVDVTPSSPAKDLDSLVVAYMEAQSFLESLLPKAPSSSASNSPTCERPLFKGDATVAKEIFDKLISYHFDDLADPKNESAIMDIISALSNNISGFNDAQARVIVNLKATFPQIIQEWRDSSQANGTSELPWSNSFEKTICVLQDLVEKEEVIRTKLEELSKKETELGAKLEAIESKSLMRKEERDQVSKHMKTVCCLVEGRASELGARGLEVDSANQKLEHRFKTQWAAMRHLFA